MDSRAKKIIRNDSGLSGRQHLLAERQGSNITLETMESGVSGPIVTDFNYSQQISLRPTPSPAPITIPGTHYNNTVLNQWPLTLSPTDAENNNDPNNELEDIPLHSIRKK